MNKQGIKCMNILEGDWKEDFNIEEVHPDLRKQGSIVVTHPKCRLIMKSREEQKGQQEGSDLAVWARDLNTHSSITLLSNSCSSWDS